MNMVQKKELIPLKQAAAEIGVTSSYLRRLCRDKRIPGRKIGRDWFFTRGEITRIINEEGKLFTRKVGN